ncbi:MAG: fimbrial biogenesis chaperone [Vulcanimicrobiaceae bacterium]
MPSSLAKCGSIVRTAIFGALIGLCATQVAASAPPSFKIDPISVTLPAANASALVSVVNEGDTDIRFQVTGAGWQQSTKGEIQLEPTKALIYFPSVFTVGAGQTKKIRVGVTTVPGNVEKTYRLTIQQLPPLQQVIAPAKGASVNTLLRVSIPVFAQPSSSRTIGYDITPPFVSGGALQFQFVNTGNTHVLLDGVSVVAKTASGSTIFDFKDRAWYVLAGGRRFWSFGLSRSQCEATRSLDIAFTSAAVTPAQEPRKTFSPVSLDCASTSR